MKKIGIILVVIICFFGFCFDISAKTLSDLKKELEVLEKNYESNQQKKQLTEKEIKEISSNIGYITNSISNSEKEIADINSEIVELNEDIARMDKEIKEIVNYAQISSGESAYLEYAFGAKDFTDFIYRSAVAQQLADYNETLINKYNALIIENNQKKEELKVKIQDLEIQSNKLNTEMAKLKDEMSSISEISLDIASQIKLQKEAIKLYQDELKCRDDEDISSCGRNKLPADTAFWRPIVSGYITSEYSWRVSPITGKVESHTGIDLSTKPNDNVPVYATANGMVIGIVSKSKCGGNMVFIHHNVNGQTYTSGYFHLRKILVNKGDIVTSRTQIAVMGGNPSIETWDGCSTGAHLHFMIAKGLYLKDYYDWSTLDSKSVNPRTLVNFPGYSFKDRTTKY